MLCQVKGFNMFSVASHAGLNVFARMKSYERKVWKQCLPLSTFDNEGRFLQMMDECFVNL